MTIFNSNLFVYQRVAWTKRMVVQLLKIPILLDCEVGSLWGICLLESLHVSAKKNALLPTEPAPFFRPQLLWLSCAISSSYADDLLDEGWQHVAWINILGIGKLPWQIAMSCHEMPQPSTHGSGTNQGRGRLHRSAAYCSSLFGWLPPLNFDGFSCEG